MNSLVVVTGFLALCFSSAVSVVPRDNSHYVEGESRYLWMTDEKGETHLVDLQKPIATDTVLTRHGGNNQYWLFTRSNPGNPQIITYGDVRSIQNTNYVASKPLKIIVHGWSGSGNSILNTMITSAFLNVFDVNVIVVDWRALAAEEYPMAVAGVSNVGQFIGNFALWLIDTVGGNWNNVHFIGFSLGAHAVGVAGRVTGGKPIRVTGLDPAGPLWYTNRNALNLNAGQYVEVIHTNIGFMGITSAIGHSDFYPNGGSKQPGCDSNQCSHSRVYELFASSVQNDHFIGRQCIGLSEGMSNRCTGATLKMGNGILNKRGSGIYGLTTKNAWPY